MTKQAYGAGTKTSKQNEDFMRYLDDRRQLDELLKKTRQYRIRIERFEKKYLVNK